LLYLVSAGPANGLRIADVDSGRTDRLLPGLSPSGTPAYAISPDDQEIVVAASGPSGKPALWLAPLDRRSAPHPIPNADGNQPFFGSDGEILFRKLEGSSGYLFAIRRDGTGLRKVFPEPVADLRGISPDRRWLAAQGQGETGTSMLAVPLTGGSAMRLPASRHEWSADGKSWFWEMIVAGVTHVIPLAPGQVWVRNGAGQVPIRADELVKLPGVRVIESGDVAPGPTGDIYAFTKTTVQRNLYRIPIP